MISCKLCGVFSKQFLDINALLSHLKFMHPHEHRYESINQQCSRIFNSISSLRKHTSACQLIVTDANIHIDRKNTGVYNNIEACDSSGSDEPVQSKNVKKTYEGKSNSVKNCILKFISKLYSNKSMARSVVQDIVDDISILLNAVSKMCTQKLQLHIPRVQHEIINECLHFDFSDIFSTEYRRFKFLKKNNLFISPEPFVIGEMQSDKVVNNTTILTMTKCYGQYIALGSKLKLFFVTWRLL